MGFDCFSPLAAAPINAVLVPAGKVDPARFAGFASRLEQECEVRLGDVSPSGQSNKSQSGKKLASISRVHG